MIARGGRPESLPPSAHGDVASSRGAHNRLKGLFGAAFRRSTSFAAIRIFLATLLFAAGALKAGSLYFNGLDTDESTLSLAQTGLLVGLEFAVGAWLLAGFADGVTWWCSIALFAAFSGVSIREVTHGARNCGCFGAVSVSPVLTFFLDTAILT